VISISDSEESAEENQIAGPSNSHPEKKVQIQVENEDRWDKLGQGLLVGRKREVEIEVEAKVELARELEAAGVDPNTIEGVIRKLGGEE